MNSLQIDSILSKNRLSKKCYKGVYGSDNIKNFHSYPYAIVVNTQKINQPGEHWVGMYVKNDNLLEYFDSFGDPPNNDIEKFTKNFKNVKQNKIKLQSDFDNSCGSHVIYFLIKRCSGESFDSIISSLRNPYSDASVKLFVYNLVKT